MKAEKIKMEMDNCHMSKIECINKIEFSDT